MGNSTMIDAYGRSDEERKALRAKVELVNRVAFENWHNPVWRREMAQEMTETIYRGFDHENLISLMSTVENLPFDGRSFVREVRGLRAFWIARGGYLEASSMHSEVFELPRDTIGFQVNEFEDKVMTNFAETQANLVRLGIERMDAEVNRRLLTTFQAAVPSSSPYYTHGMGLALASVNSALRSVREVSRDHNVAIVGRATMTEQFMDLLLGKDSNGSGFLPETNENLVQRGVLGSYRGSQIITLTNYLDDTDTPFFPANELYVIGRDASKVAFYGGLLAKESTEDDEWMWRYIARRDAGFVVHRPNRLRRIVDDSISAFTSDPYA